MKIGILALQGSFIEHKQALEKLDVEAIEVRQPQDTEGIDGLIIPGGESTTMGKLMLEYGLDNREFATPVLYMRTKDGNVF